MPRAAPPRSHQLNRWSLICFRPCLNVHPAIALQLSFTVVSKSLVTLSFAVLIKNLHVSAAAHTPPVSDLFRNPRHPYEGPTAAHFTVPGSVLFEAKSRRSTFYQIISAWLRTHVPAELRGSVVGSLI